MKAYTLREYKHTGEYHIFVGEFLSADGRNNCIVEGIYEKFDSVK